MRGLRLAVVVLSATALLALATMLVSRAALLPSNQSAGYLELLFVTVLAGAVEVTGTAGYADPSAWEWTALVAYLASVPVLVLTGVASVIAWIVLTTRRSRSAMSTKEGDAR